MTVEDHKELARRVQEEVWNEGDVDAVDDLFVEDFVQHSPWEPSELHGRDEFKEQVRSFHAAFPDLHGTVDDVIAEGDTVANRFTMRATHRGEFVGAEPTGEEVEFVGTIFARVEDGRIAERWVVDDVLGFLEDLGKIEER
ncbi:ester cyclase [Salinilacihabitans rarus]|uniref:ester cyclase n=1 Tax=Salinilacihabitans rarus TaxID=2961596 RepID=UPI0020C862D2|nr:ester cyclase [Salinilacihabitans rarus]